MSAPVYPRRGSRSLLRVREHWDPRTSRRWAVVRERGRGQSDEVVATFASREEAVRALPYLRRAG